MISQFYKTDDHFDFLADSQHISTQFASPLPLSSQMQLFNIQDKYGKEVGCA